MSIKKIGWIPYCVKGNKNLIGPWPMCFEKSKTDVDKYAKEIMDQDPDVKIISVEVFIKK